MAKNTNLAVVKQAKNDESYTLISDIGFELAHYAAHFRQPDGSLKPFGNILWCTNIDIPRRHERLELTRRYADNPGKYSGYDNYEAIAVPAAVLSGAV